MDGRCRLNVTDGGSTVGIVRLLLMEGPVGTEIEIAVGSTRDALEVGSSPKLNETPTLAPLVPRERLTPTGAVEGTPISKLDIVED